MAADLVPIKEAIERSVFSFVGKKSRIYAEGVRGFLPEMADQLEEDLLAFGYSIVPTHEAKSEEFHPPKVPPQTEAQ